MKKPSSPIRLTWLLVPLLIGLVSCGKPQEDPAAAAEGAEALASLEATNARLEKDLNVLRVDFAKRQAEIIQKNEDLTKSNDSLKSQFERAQEEAAKARRELETYMAKYKLT